MADFVFKVFRCCITSTEQFSIDDGVTAPHLDHTIINVLSRKVCESHSVSSLSARIGDPEIQCKPIVVLAIPVAHYVLLCTVLYYGTISRYG
jgi:hypothetical protein